MNNKPIKILLLTANPVNTSQLRLGEEVRSIQEELGLLFFGLFGLLLGWIWGCFLGFLG